jgi:hypothetical protein
MTIVSCSEVRLFFVLTGALILQVPDIEAGSLTSLNSDVVAVYTQTSGTAPTIPSFYFYSVSGQFTNSGDFTLGTLTYPGPASPQPLNVPGGGKHLFVQLAGDLPDAEQFSKPISVWNIYCQSFRRRQPTCVGVAQLHPERSVQYPRAVSR